MNKKNLALTIGGALATVLTASPVAVQADTNPFAMQPINGAQTLAEADEKAAEGACSGKMTEGKCGEGKCGAKMKEGGCSAATGQEKKMSEGGCNGKMKEGGCSGSAK